MITGPLDDLDEIRTFALVTESGSLSAAARLLSVTPNAVSRRVMRMERNLGVQLFRRSTRAVSVTAEGRALYARARRVLDELDAAREELSAGRTDLAGSIRVAIPGGACSTGVLRGIAGLLTQHPELRLHVRVVNAPVDPIGGGFDIVLHVGPLKDSRLVARPLFKASWALAAAPGYVARHGTPRRVADLAAHACLRLAGDLPQDEWQLVDKSGRVETVSVSGNFEADDSRVLGDATYAGLGIGLRPARELDAAVTAGTLVRVLPGYRFAALDVYAVMPKGISRLSRVARLLALLADVLHEQA